jgi:hypothetical protein
MIHLAKANCRFCAHYRGDRKCLAFPESIPDSLWNGENLHREAYEGDQGFRYQRAFDELPPLPDHFFNWGKP